MCLGDRGEEDKVSPACQSARALSADSKRDTLSDLHTHEGVVRCCLLHSVKITVRLSASHHTHAILWTAVWGKNMRYANRQVLLMTPWKTAEGKQ